MERRFGGMVKGLFYYRKVAPLVSAVEYIVFQYFHKEFLLVKLNLKKIQFLGRMYGDC